MRLLEVRLLGRWLGECFVGAEHLLWYPKTVVRERCRGCYDRLLEGKLMRIQLVSVEDEETLAWLDGWELFGERFRFGCWKSVTFRSGLSRGVGSFVEGLQLLRMTC